MREGTGAIGAVSWGLSAARRANGWRWRGEWSQWGEGEGGARRWAWAGRSCNELCARCLMGLEGGRGRQRDGHKWFWDGGRETTIKGGERLGWTGVRRCSCGSSGGASGVAGHRAEEALRAVRVSKLVGAQGGGCKEFGVEFRDEEGQSLVQRSTGRS
ncbi:uncharacterized protein A4U43_C07F26180 [Asparagus officinalis]|uniref:Uncharacterized protein n=1 Tax=Asparagus officinalis TaxID=4686 RepID=A0A5P1EF05_ASPOF|nr:uncharacterized protein A4U43_C07F26180 [Asparagus officinalis]